MFQMEQHACMISDEVVANISGAVRHITTISLDVLLKLNFIQTCMLAAGSKVTCMNELY